MDHPRRNFLAAGMALPAAASASRSSGPASQARSNPSSTSPTFRYQTLGKATANPFSAADQKIPTAHLERIAPLYCRMCGECNGTCRQGLPVADVLRFLTYADGYGQFALGRENFLQLPPGQAAVKCGTCPGCTVECPYGVRVSERLIRAQEMFTC